MIVWIEGVHGAGKTTLVQELGKRGVITVDENFLG